MSHTTVHYEGQLRCRATHEKSGTVLVTDAPRENHGTDASFSPSDLLSVSLGSCILSSIGLFARSMDIDIAGATATVEKTMGNNPRRITGISVRVHVPADLNAEQQSTLEAAAHACPVHNALKIDAPISFEWGSASDCGDRSEVEHPSEN